MHTSAQKVAAPSLLPDRGPGHYLEQLSCARESIQQGLANPAFRAGDLVVLRAIIRQLDVIELRWQAIETLCGRMPSTLVHGDFRPKNTRTRSTEAGLSLLPLDWETAGWGSPAKDLAHVDVHTYW